LGDRKLITILFGFALLLVLPLSFDAAIFADDDDDDDDDYKKKYKKNTTKVIHLGFLQLAAHDFFNVNRCLDEFGVHIPGCDVKDSENGKLDASTVLFNPLGGDCDFKKSRANEGDCELYTYGENGEIAKGGEIRSSENIMISTAGALVGEKYLKLVDKHGEEKAYKKTLKYYHKQIKKAYEESFHLKFPKAKAGDVTQLHNLAIRAGHDFLPAEIKFNGVMTSLFAIDPLGEKLSKKEKRQKSSHVDGEFDEEFTGIDFCPVPPHFCIKVDLLLADQNFGEQFAFNDGPKYNQHMDGDTFDELMLELKDGKFNKKDRVSKLLKEAFSRGLSFDK